MRRERVLKVLVATFQSIERWYNRNKIHSSFGYQPPQSIENQMRKVA
ncbi:hypothetical protein [Priestia aryabhattai]